MTIFELFRSIRAAVAVEDFDQLIGLLVEVNLSFARIGRPVDAKVFEGMMDLLDFARNSGDCARHVFEWFMSNGAAFDRGQTRVLRRYVADTYPKFGSTLLISEVADWVGGWRDGEAVAAVRSWMGEWPELSSDARRGVETVLRDMLDGSPIEMSAEELADAKEMQKDCERLMRGDRLRQTTLH